MYRQCRLSRAPRWAALLVLVVGLSGCRGASTESQTSDTSSPAGGVSASSPGTGSGAGELRFWHTRRQQQQQELEAIVAEFNAKHPGTTIKAQFQGSYPQLYQKVTASIQTRQLPDLAVAYESQIAEYMAADIVVPLDPLVADPQIGLSKEDLADIRPQYLEANRFPRYNNQLLSFPFTKSNLVMYYNRDRLKQAGFSKAPETWDEFLTQCRAVTVKTGKPAWALSLDPSTIDGMIFSFGGELLSPDGRSTRFDEPPTVRALELIDRAVTGKLAYQVDDETLPNDFASQNATFIMMSSASRPAVEAQIAGKFDWDIAIIPHAAGVQPVTVMYGPNICIFRSDTARERAAWEFVKYFTSTEVTARWATRTGYMPVRKSAAETELLKQFFAQNPRARHAYEITPYARPEPNVSGWQEVRDMISEAVTSVISQTREPAAAARRLKEQADRVVK